MKLTNGTEIVLEVLEPDGNCEALYLMNFPITPKYQNCKCYNEPERTCEYHPLLTMATNPNYRILPRAYVLATT